MSKRSIAHHEGDTRRTLQGHTPRYMKGYIGRHIVRILVADEMLTKQTGVSLLSPGLKNALMVMKPLAVDVEPEGTSASN